MKQSETSKTSLGTGCQQDAAFAQVRSWQRRGWADLMVNLYMSNPLGHIAWMHLIYKQSNIYNDQNKWTNKVTTKGKKNNLPCAGDHT